MHPVDIIAFFSSSFIFVNTFSTPFYPPAANPHRIGLPMNTAFAPIANALSTSVPLLMPPSKNISTFLPFNASTTSSSTSIVAGVVSNYLAPWFDTNTASAPLSTADIASSLHIIPLATTGKPESIFIYLMISQLIWFNLCFLEYSANPESFPLDLTLDSYPVAIYLA